MKSTLLLLLLCHIFFVSSIKGYPYGYYRSYPRTVMFGSYYGQPFDPTRGLMGFAAGDTIATNSFVGDEQQQNEAEFVEISTEKQRPLQESSTFAIEDTGDEEVQVQTQKPKTARKSTKKTQSKNDHHDDDDEDDNNDRSDSGDDQIWPFSWKNSAAKIPSYNTFFPIMIGGGSAGGTGVRRKSSGSDNDSGGSYTPGSATAIANSFSTGKGGVATSHATSFGDPYFMSTLLRSAAGKRAMSPRTD